MLQTVVFQWIDPCPNERLAKAQERLKESVIALGLEPTVFPAGPSLVKLRDILRFGHEHAKGQSFVWCNSDVTLTRDPFLVDDQEKIQGFHRREVPSGSFCGGVDMYLVPSQAWKRIIEPDLPDLWCGATHVDWWLTRAAVISRNYSAHFGYIDHVSHPESPASKRRSDTAYRHNIREYNRWAKRHNAGVFEEMKACPLVGESLSPLSDMLRWAGRQLQRHRNV